MLRRLDSTAKADYAQEAKDYDAQRLVAKAKERLVEKEIKESIENGGDGLSIAHAALADAPSAPVRRRYYTNDSTVEKLGELLKDNPFGVLVFRDELTGLLRGLDKEGQEGARSFYLEAWAGTSPFTFDRIGRGTIEIDSAIVSVLGGIQPGPLATYLKACARTGLDDGLMQRFQLLVYPDVPTAWKNVDRFPVSTAKSRAAAAYERAAKLDAAQVGAQSDGPDQIPYLRFTAEAQAVFDKWRAPLERQVRSGAEDPAIESHLSKYRSLVPSLALLLHLADDQRGPVGPDAVSRAIGWAKHLEAHARRVYGLVVGGHQECLAIAKHILKGDLQDGFDARSVYRPCWSHLDSPEAAEKGLEELVQLGWLAEERLPTAGRSATVFLINPKLWDTHPRPTDRTDRSTFAGTAGDSRGEDTAQGGTDGTDRRASGREGDEWSTPVEIIEAARLVLGCIDIDPATNLPAQQRVRATTYYTKEDNGLLYPWFGRSWMNPPYSYPLIELFMEKLVREYENGNVTAAIALVNSRTDTKWFHAASAAATATCLYRGRIRFLRPCGEPGPSPTHAQVLFYFGPDAAAFEREFSPFGRVTIAWKEGAA